MKMEYEKAVSFLVMSFPELEVSVRGMAKTLGDSGPAPTIIFEDVFSPYVRVSLQRGKKEELERIFDFIETLSRDRDPRVKDLVRYCILGALRAHESEMKTAERYMGEFTRLRLGEVW